MIIDGGDHAAEEDEELQVLLRGVGRVEQVLAISGDRPVVVLARAVDVVERLLVLQANEAVVGSDDLHLLHREKVVVNRLGAGLEDRGELVLARGNLVVLGLSRNGELPELVIELLHELVDRRADGAEVVLLKLLALDRLAAKERTAAHDEVRTGSVVLLLDEEVLLLRANGGGDGLDVLAKELQDALGLGVEGNTGTKQRGLLVERLAGVGNERGGDAEDLVLDESGGSRVPSGVTAGLEGGAKAAGGEARSVRLTLDERLAREGLEGATVTRGLHEGIVLLGRDTREGLEPVRVMRGTLLERPLLHSVGHLVGDVEVERLALLDNARELLVRGLGQPITHDGVAED